MSRFGSLIRELRQRRVIRALLAYGAGVAAVLQGADMVFTALALPDLAYRLLVIVSIAGFPLVAVLAWAYDLTADGLRRTTHASLEVRRQPVSLARYLELIGAFTVAALIIMATSGAVSALRYPYSDDGRVGLAIFPLRTSGSTGDEWSEGAADLLSTALEGTPGLRIVDPWSLWASLRPEAGAPARVPDLREAEDLCDRIGAHRFLLGSAVSAGGQVELTFRLYRLGRSEPIDVFAVSTNPSAMENGVRRTAVRVLSRVWGPLRPVDVPAELDFDATQSPEALKAYLAAKEAMRRGMVDSANTAIDRSLALDSTFVLAVVEAVHIKSWNLWHQGRPFTGLGEVLARADSFKAGLDERSRLRLEAVRAMVKTDGPTAIAATNRILELDSLDYGANTDLAYARNAYGWQLSPPAYGTRALAERVVRLDSTQLTALLARVWWAVVPQDSADERVQLQRLLRVDTSSALARSTIVGLRSLLASDDAYQGMLSDIAAVPQEEFIQVVRLLRWGNLPRYQRLLENVAAEPDAPGHRVASAENIRLTIARGWTENAGEMLDAGSFSGSFPAIIQMFVAAADLAGVGDRISGEEAVAWLSGYVPLDSALAYFDDRPVWNAGWLIGAWQAQVGDTMLARQWIEVLGSLPPGGTPKDYRGALQSDIEARLAIRRGRPDTALPLERTAMDLWSIHSDNQFEYAPSPMMRLSMALLLRDAGQREEAAALLSSLVPPTTWLGLVTARADFELGVLAAEDDDWAAARLHLGRALALWDEEAPPVAALAERARAELARTPGR